MTAFAEYFPACSERIIQAGEVPLHDPQHVQLPTGEIVEIPPGGEGIVTLPSGQVTHLPSLALTVVRKKFPPKQENHDSARFPSSVGIASTDM